MVEMVEMVEVVEAAPMYLPRDLTWLSAHYSTGTYLSLAPKPSTQA